MKLSPSSYEKLLANWGSKADAMACNVELRVYDPLSRWACYIYALNPADSDEIACMVVGETVEICDWRLSQLAECYNSEGEPPQIDVEWKPRRASEVCKQLHEEVGQ